MEVLLTLNLKRLIKLICQVKLELLHTFSVRGFYGEPLICIAYPGNNQIPWYLLSHKLDIEFGLYRAKIDTFNCTYFETNLYKLQLILVSHPPVFSSHS